jgi:Tfp pilus assembly protein PilO
VLSVILVVAAWLVIVQPKRNQASSLNTQISSAQSQLANAQAQVATAEANKAAYPKNYAQYTLLGEAAPSDPDVGSLIYQISHAAAQTAVTFRTLSLAASSTATASPASIATAALPTLPFQFTFDGNFFNLSNFFLKLQRFVTATSNEVAVSGRLLNLNSIQFGAGPNGFPGMTATVQATSYMAPASTATPTTP